MLRYGLRTRIRQFTEVLTRDAEFIRPSHNDRSFRAHVWVPLPYPFDQGIEVQIIGSGGPSTTYSVVIDQGTPSSEYELETIDFGGVT